MSSDVSRSINAIYAIAEAIRTAGEIPSGTLYAMVMGTGGLSLAAYEGAIRTLKGAKLVSESGHLLRWVGPEVKS